MHVYRRPSYVPRRRPWIGTVAAPAVIIVQQIVAIYAYPGGKSGPPGTVEL